MRRENIVKNPPPGNKKYKSDSAENEQVGFRRNLEKRNSVKENYANHQCCDKSCKYLPQVRNSKPADFSVVEIKYEENYNPDQAKNRKRKDMRQGGIFE